MAKNFLYKGKRVSTKKQIYTVPHFFKFRNLFYMPIKALRDLYLDVKYFIHRGRHGWADVDWFNLDSYLLHILPDMLEELANKSYGYSETFINADGNKVGNLTNTHGQARGFPHHEFYDTRGLEKLSFGNCSTFPQR